MSISSKILIIDFGSQYTQLIARRLRGLKVYCEVFSYNCDPARIRQFAPSGIILSGGPDSSMHGNAPRAPDVVFELECPILGICYGMQTMVAQMGGQVENAEKHEYGEAKLLITGNENPLFRDIDDELDREGLSLLRVWMSHGDAVLHLPEGFDAIGHTENCPYAAIVHAKKRYYGVQFHPEVSHTQQGKRILSRFIEKICGIVPDWQMEEIIALQVSRIQEQVGEERVILGLSGGVDSQVAAVLLHRAIGDQLTCVYVDTGLMRLKETEEVLDSLIFHEKIKIVTIDAKERFFAALKGVVCPEEKRKTIGRLFIDVFSDYAKSSSNATFLAQGTIYSDVIESAGDSLHAKVIKSHHNVGGLPEKMSLKLVEPLRILFKDEVRELGLELGLPYDSVYRHPFPGPGLAVRILGEVKPEYVALLQKVDAIFIAKLREHNLYHTVSQAFAVFLPVKSVGVGGDQRRYEYVVALRAVTTDDFMTATWAPLSHDFLNQVSHTIINEVPGISRVTYDISSKPPATIEWE